MKKYKLLFLIYLIPLVNFSITYNDIYNYAAKIGIEQPEYCAAHAIKECGWALESNGAKMRNNYFGFSDGHNYLTFETMEECVQYYASWKKKYQKGRNYHDFLRCIYRGKNGCKPYCPDIEGYIKDLEIILWRFWSC